MRIVRQIDRLLKLWWKYRNKNRYIVRIGDASAQFALDDWYSKSWFLPRYDGGRIHEPSVTCLMTVLLRKAKIFVDVGAHLGYFSCIASKQLAESGQVVAFEMDDRSFRRAKKNFEIGSCSNAKILHAAVADNTDGVSYWRPKRRSGPGLSIAATTGDERVSVESVVLDEFFAAGLPTPAVIKIDVEGAEANVLRGMSKILAMPDIEILLEVHEPQLRELGSSGPEVIEHLKSNQYRVFSLPSFRRDAANTFDEIDGSSLPPNAFVYATRRAPPKLDDLESVEYGSETIRSET